MNLKKRADLEASLNQGMTQVVLDATREGVSVPPHLIGNIQVRLNLSYAFNLRVFEINDEGVRASLSFNRVEHLCVLPWRSIYSMQLTRGEEVGRLYFESLPQALKAHFLALSGLSEEELRAQMSGEGSAEVTKPTAPPKAHIRRADEVIEDESLDESWEERLPQVGEPSGTASGASAGEREGEGEGEGEGEDEEGAISFQSFTRKKG